MIYVGFGAFFGAIARFSLSNWISRLNKSPFPIATFLVNCVGCFLIGIVIQKVDSHSQYLLLSVGFLGAFTTFSTFSLETMLLIEKKLYKLAFFYVAGTILIGLGLTFFSIQMFD